MKNGIVAIFFLACCSCGPIPGISETRVDFPPWEKLPQGNGITYLQKYTQDGGIDPLYLAMFQYRDDAALQRVIDTFGLKPSDSLEPRNSFTTVVVSQLSWFHLEGTDKLYEFPTTHHEYAANLWVDTSTKTAVIERVWW